jgi:catechol 2,3-dioxygenase-like lactoylglutathione lyase family enzyme
VRAVLGRLRADGGPITEQDDDPGIGVVHVHRPRWCRSRAPTPMVSFTCTDPDGHRVEVYWEE